ncbi:putative pol protein [Gregarina niphandrodes]|uniref:Pol protein n=1 Tax=Gregarina niphandrodes TaxID=110365 RepID=A0A023AWJ8_GRENI|nr:putative pol protein [Gregarina niphandrodes]EZG42808.1 putative pol protein [Gregarina niphandrodes]|eukprot:XP_011133913.1 putative pol protein [Gregarina niphandrodes]
MPRRGRGFVVMTDASGTGLGGILLQRGENQQPALCACISQAFTETERKWSTTEREAYAIVRSLEKFAGMVQGEPIVVVTDHKALTALDTTEQGKLMRWRMNLCEYDVQFQYVEGNSNLVADWLSRLHPDHDRLLYCRDPPSSIRHAQADSATSGASGSPAPE